MKKGQQIRLKASADWHIFAYHSITQKLPLYIIEKQGDLLFVAIGLGAAIDDCQQIYEQDVELFEEPKD